jgi:hypothetical protein
MSAAPCSAVRHWQDTACSFKWHKCC